MPDPLIDALRAELEPDLRMAQLSVLEEAAKVADGWPAGVETDRDGIAWLVGPDIGRAIRAIALKEDGDITVRRVLRAMVSPAVLPLLVERGRLTYDLCRRGCAPGFDDFVRDSCETIFRAAFRGDADGKG